MSDHSKRTRSQLILSEEFEDIHLGISPLRAARLERKRNVQTDPPAGSSEATPLSIEVGGDESDDELLLSPHKTRPPKRQPLSQQPESPSRTDHERQCKRFKQDHLDEQSHLVTETRRPIGPFDFSAVNPELPHCTSHEQPGESSKQRAHTFPLDSPTIRRRDLGQLMPSPEKASIVPLQDVLRSSSLPRSLGPSTDAMTVDNDANAKLLEESKRDESSERSQTPPPSTELDSSSSLETPVTEEKCTTTPNSPSAASGMEVMTFSLAQLPAMTPRISPEEPDRDITPKPVNPPLTSSLDVNPIPLDPIPLALGGPSSLPDDAPSPLSTLSSMSELSPPPHEPEIHTPKVEHRSGIPRAIQPPSSAPLRDTTENSGTELSQVARSTTTSSRGGERGFARPIGSARLTRSSSIKKQEVGSLDEDVNSRPQGVAPESSLPSSVPTKRPSDSPALAPDFSKKKPSSVALSHRKAFSFAMPTSSSRNKTTEKAPASSPVRPSLFIKQQPPKLPSSIKPVSSLGLGELPHPPKHTGLSNLSLALEKLKNPPPLRPATTLGFNSDTRFVFNAPKAKDDSTIRLGHGLPSSAKASTTPLRRAVTVEPDVSFELNAHASGSGPATLITPRSANPTESGPSVKKINVNSGIIVGKNPSSRPGGFVYGGVGKKRPFEKVSKKSSLPVVVGSPVKACGSAKTMDLDEPRLPSTTEVLAATLSARKEDNGQEEAPTVPAAVERMNLQDAIAEHVDVVGLDNSSAEDGKVEHPDIWKHASRRASLASQFLQQTLAVLPSTPPPPKASDSKSKAAERSQFSSQRTRSGLRSGTSSDVGSSRTTPKTLSNGHMVGTHVSKSGSTTATSSSLKVLKSCTIFVDVRTDDGDDAGGLFVDMLKGLGAKIIGRAGQSCTHIVYKNGLMSTLTKYRLMREPKPFVVGISWVVECAEKCRRVGEENFLVDLEGVNVAGNNKRRRSMLPKHMSWSIQSHPMAPPSLPGSSQTGMLASDRSMDGSLVGADRSMHSSDGPAEDEDDLPPLERARQRRNIFFK